MSGSPENKTPAAQAPLIGGLIAIIVAVGSMVAKIAGYTDLPIAASLMLLIAGLALIIVGISLNAGGSAKAKQDPPD